MADHRCSFCGKGQDQVKKLIAGPTLRIMICDGCVALCNQMGFDPLRRMAVTPQR